MMKVLASCCWWWAYRLRLVHYCWQHDQHHWFARACKHYYVALDPSTNACLAREDTLGVEDSIPDE